MDQEPKLSIRQFRHKIGNTSRRMLLRRLRQRRIEVVRESDVDNRGARTILQWLQSDLDRYHAVVECMESVDENLHTEAALTETDQVLSTLLFKCKAVLYTGGQPDMGNLKGWDFVQQSEEHSVVCCDYTAGGVSREEFKRRFVVVAGLIQTAVDLLEGQNWSVDSHGT